MLIPKNTTLWCSALFAATTADLFDFFISPISISAWLLFSSNSSQCSWILWLVTYHKTDVIRIGLNINLCDCSIIQGRLGFLYRVIWRISFKDKLKMGLQDCKKTYLLWTISWFYCHGVEHHDTKMINQGDFNCSHFTTMAGIAVHDTGEKMNLHVKYAFHGKKKKKLMLI